MAGHHAPSHIEASCPESLDEAVPYLRAAGLSKIQSMVVLIHRHGLSLADAKAAVHQDAAWADQREPDDSFHDDLERLVAELG